MTHLVIVIISMYFILLMTVVSGIRMTVLLVTLLSSLMITTTSPIYQDNSNLTPDLDNIRFHEASGVTMERIFHYPANFIRNLNWHRRVKPRFTDSGRAYSRLRSD